MKIRLAFFVLSVLAAGMARATMQVQMSYSTFFSPGSGPYIEVYLSFVPAQLEYIKGENGYYGEILVDYTFDNGTDTIKVENFIVQTPIVDDSNAISPPFVSQHRIFLKNGDYYMNLTIRESANAQEAISTNQRISLNYSPDELGLSDIEMFQSSRQTNERSMFYKNGFEIIPYPYDIFPQSLNQVGFYAELYNAENILGKDADFLITYHLQDYEDGSVIENFKGFSRKKASQVNVIMGQFLMTTLNPGNYYIVIEVLSRENELLTSKKIAFHKENPPFELADAYEPSFVDRYTNVDSLAQHIAYLEPISDRLEWEFATNQLEKQNFDLMKKYFLNFWQQRDPANPEQAWKDYLQQVRITNANFTTPMLPGYLTDRGFRYLKYGPPHDRFESFDEPQAFPYEIWYYNKVNLQSNRMIVFANKSEVLNDYVIIHSDINGELYNKNWNLELHRIAPGFVDDPNPVMQDHFGNRAKEWTNLPR